MRSMFTVLLVTGMLMSTKILFGADYATLINVNLHRYNSIMTGAAGTGAPGDIWNNIAGNFTSLYTDLLDSNSNATTVAVQKNNMMIFG